MAKLSDCLVATACGRPTEWLVRFAFAMQMRLEQAMDLYDENGSGMIYAKSGMVMPYTERMATRMEKSLGRITIVLEDGTILVRHHGITKKIEQKEARQRRASAYEVEKQNRVAEKRARIIRRDREHMFDAAQGHPSPKRQGKADSLGDIGKYAWNPRVYISEKYPMSMEDSRYHRFG